MAPSAPAEARAASPTNAAEPAREIPYVAPGTGEFRGYVKVPETAHLKMRALNPANNLESVEMLRTY